MAGVTTGVKIFVRHLGETLVLPTIADGVVTAAKMATNSVDGTKIAMGSDAQGDILYHGATDYARLAKGTASQQLRMNSGATAPEWATITPPASGWTHATEQATSSGTSVTFGSIPAGVKVIKVIFHTVDGNGTGHFLHVKIGDAGGIESTGYRGSTAGSLITALGCHFWDGTSGFEIVDASTVADDYNGVLTLHRQNSGEHKWVGTSMVAGCPAQANDWGAGTKTLSAELTQLQIWSTVTFQDGTINVIYMS
jgi:hypothetical protein